MGVTCRGCKMSGKTAPKEQMINKLMSEKTRKNIDDMTDAEILDECAEYSALKHGHLLGSVDFVTAKEQAKAAMGAVPAMHLKIMLEKHRSG